MPDAEVLEITAIQASEMSRAGAGIAEAIGRESSRTAVVQWLRLMERDAAEMSQGKIGDERLASHIRALADGIERGDHV